MAKPRRTKKRPLVAAAFRLDASRRLARVLVIGAGLVLVGAVFSAAGMLAAHGHPPMGRPHLRAATDVGGNLLPASSLAELWPGIVGLVLVVAGALFSLVALRRVLAEESYLALRADGALYVHGKDRRLLRWADVEDVRSERGRIVFSLHDGELTELDAAFSGKSVDDVAAACREVRRKALFGLLR